MKKIRTMALVAATLAFVLSTAIEASAQVEPERLRFDWVTGVLLSGELASSTFVFDTTTVGGDRTERSGGWLDIDPSLWFGLETTWRLNSRFSVSGSWMHSTGRFRVQYPALASDEGNFDLEGLLLAGEDFNNAQTDALARSAMSDALTDVFLASLVYETSLLNRWAFPYFSAGAGLYRLKSDGPVIDIVYDGAIPTRFEIVEILGIDPLAASGIHSFSIDATDPVISLGGGLRASISSRWGFDLMFEDLIRLGVDHSDIDGATPDANPDEGRLISTTFTGKTGTIHNIGVRLAVNYAFWPDQRPR